MKERTKQPAARDLEVDTRALRQASFLLGSFPHLVRQVLRERENLLEAGQQGAFVEAKRCYGYSDPTGWRGVRLAEAAETLALLQKVRRFIDREVVTRQDRKLVTAVWRYGGWGWPLVARTLGRSKEDVRLSWLELATRLAAALPEVVEDERVDY